MRHLVFALTFFLISLPAYAQRAGEPCQKFGQTIVADDKKSVLACLHNALQDDGTAPSLVWMLNTSAPKAWQSGGNTSPDPFYTIGPERKAGE